ncbi:MAG TPA: hypothetical protein VGB52_03245 [Actinomycetota bacterium]
MDNHREVVANPFGGWDAIDPALPGSLGNFPSIEEARAVAQGSLLRAGGGMLLLRLPDGDETIEIEEPGLRDLVRD